jgi:isopenicillin-N N-acyltransferase-like protein
MTAESIPVIKATGTHREVGYQIGEKLKARIQRGIAEMRGERFPLGATWDEMMQKGRLCLTHSRAAYPQLIEEVEGLAEGADVPLDEAFLAMCEELWEPAAWRGGGCTDFAARGRATATGATLLAHTNDVSPRLEKDLVILQIQAGDEPEFLGVGFGGLGFSAGFNAAGISLTGNMVWCNDIRPGVPRMLIVRAILGARRLGEAMRACLLPTRASNYNNIIADASGEIYSMEGSATDCEPIYIDGDILAHANHFVSPPMRRFEADRATIACSVIRHNRAWRLLRENFAQLSPELFRGLLADHVNYPNSICRHGEDTETVFSIIIDLENLRAWIGRGHPCETTYVEHTLTPWSRPDNWPQMGSAQ